MKAATFSASRPEWLLYPPNRFLPPKVRALIDYLVEHIDDRK